MTTDPTTSTTDPGETETTTGGGVPDWGEGDPPDFGDLGPDGVGAVNVVHALAFDGAVDVWLVGDASPIATDLARADAILVEDIPRDARRVVLAEAGTLDAVACSDWFPLRADEQWAVVAARDSHTCPSPSTEGASLTFEQDLSLAGTPVRYVHAAAPDDLIVIRSDTPEPGTLTPLSTLGGTDLPDCSSGCLVPYEIEGNTLPAAWDFSFQVLKPENEAPPGEMLLVVVGDLRQDWPSEPNAMALIRVDIDGTARVIGRDPEVVPLGFNVPTVDFAIPSPPAVFTFATVPECGFGDSCPRPAYPFRPGPIDFFAAVPGKAQVMESFVLLSGHRYLLSYTDGDFGANLALIDVDFDRSDDTVATGRGYNVVRHGPTLSLGRLFAGAPSAIFTDIDYREITDDGDLPVGIWDQVYAYDGAPLPSTCFSGVNTPAGWRGLIGDEFLIEMPTWPPAETRLVQACF